MNQMNALMQGSRERWGDTVKRWLSGNAVFSGTWSWSPQSPDCEKLVFVGYKPPSVWYFLCQSKQTKTTWHKAFLPRMFLTHFFHSLFPLPPLSRFLPSLPTGKIAINSHCLLFGEAVRTTVLALWVATKTLSLASDRRLHCTSVNSHKP